MLNLPLQHSNELAPEAQEVFSQDEPLEHVHWSAENKEN
jgi:hypothetical protein